jgi:hypothetical protein
MEYIVSEILLSILILQKVISSDWIVLILPYRENNLYTEIARIMKHFSASPDSFGPVCLRHCM